MSAPPRSALPVDSARLQRTLNDLRPGFNRATPVQVDLNVKPVYNHKRTGMVFGVTTLGVAALMYLLKPRFIYVKDEVGQPTDKLNNVFIWVLAIIIGLLVSALAMMF